MATLEIKGDADVKIEIFGRVLFDKDTPFDFKKELTEHASQTFPLGPAEVTVGIDGDNIGFVVSFDGFPFLHKNFKASDALKAPIPFDRSFFGDRIKGTITLTEV